ncbi:hypothetical protein BH10PLA1_BH10PLA1_21060 [soil metagenome]
MVRVSLQIDQAVLIGRGMSVMPTDIDANGVRLIARGAIVGGPSDGEQIMSVHELSKGQSLHLGLNVVVTLIRLESDCALFDVLAPKHMPITTPDATRPPAKPPEAGSEFED